MNLRIPLEYRKLFRIGRTNCRRCRYTQTNALTEKEPEVSHLPGIIFKVLCCWGRAISLKNILRLYSVQFCKRFAPSRTVNFLHFFQKFL
jgi:hypothetical protein